MYMCAYVCIYIYTRIYVRIYITYVLRAPSRQVEVLRAMEYGGVYAAAAEQGANGDRALKEVAASLHYCITILLYYYGIILLYCYMVIFLYYYLFDTPLKRGRRLRRRPLGGAPRRAVRGEV